MRMYRVDVGRIRLARIIVSGVLVSRTSLRRVIFVVDIIGTDHTDQVVMTLSALNLVRPCPPTTWSLP